MSEQNSYSTLTLAYDGDLAVITLNRPEKRNAFSSRMYHEVKLGVLSAGVHPDVDSILIQGQPGVFASGGDLSECLDILKRVTLSCCPYTRARDLS